MTISSEDDVKKALNIDSWRNLSKEKLLAFVAEMPKMEKEVAPRAIDQFPNFKTLVHSALDSFEQRHESVQKNAWKSQKKVHDAYESYRKALSRELDRGDLTREQRFSILEMLRVAVDKESEKDSEHKAFALRMVSIAATVGTAAVAVAVVALGGKAGFGSGGNRE